MNLRKILISLVLGVAILALGMMISQGMIASKEDVVRKSPPAAIREVATVLVENQARSPESDILGMVTSLDRSELYAEVSGRLKRSNKRFKEGVRYAKGEVIFRIDNEEARLALVSQKSAFLSTLSGALPDIRLDFPDRYDTWKDYAASIEMDQPLSKLPEASSDREKFFLSGRNIFNQFFNIESQQARLDKYNIRAPFDGVVSEAIITEGTLVRSGQKLGTLTTEGSFEIEGTIPKDAARLVKRNDQITFRSEDGKEWDATVTRISTYVDPSTQSIKLFSRIASSDLQEGMYLRGEIESDPIEEVMEISNDWLKNERTLFLVRDTVLQQIEVDVLHKGEKKALVKGLPQGATLLAEDLTGAFDGMSVKIRRP